MTYQQNGNFSCDECPESIETGESDFSAALAAITAAGWRTFKGPDKKWAHACPACVEDYVRNNYIKK